MTIDTAEPSAAREVLARSLVQIRTLRARLDEAEQARTEPIAVIGMGCRLPGGVRSPEQYWDFLLRSRSGTVPVPPERWDPKRWGGIAGGGFLDEVDRFDAGFFGISPREAAALDPQQRMFLEVAWEALEHAGQAPDRLGGSPTGVYLGVTTYDYTQSQMQQVVPDELEMYCTTSNASTFAAGRLSYWLGLSGPSLSVDTACSSSLVAVHLACQSLRSGETSMALAGGVNVLLSPEWFLLMSQAGMLAEDGRCKTFDASADGYGRGEGCGVVVLKRLSTALADNDRIEGLILGSAVNQDGRSSGITVPNPAAQTDVVRAALRAARVEGSRVGYIEAHGTGTPLGDPLELRALRAALGAPTGSEPPLVGSAKTNFGHLEAAAGVVGLIKALMTVRHGTVPPHLNLTEVNPAIDLDQLHLRIPVEPTAFPAGPGPRVAGVSGFGVSGTNAHVVVGEPPAPEPDANAPEPRNDHLLALSAKSSAALDELVRAYQDRLAAADEQELPDLCHTAAVGRAVLPFRAAVVGRTAQALREGLAEAIELPAEDTSPYVHTGRVSASARPRVAFLFTGQGSQYAPMAASLYRTEPLVRELFDQADELLEPVLGRRLLPLMLDGSLDAGLIDETRYTQPALFILEYAVARLWRSWGVEPAALLGHSVGELAAACVAGAMDWTEGALLAAHRGRLMQELTPAGAMVTVFAESQRVRELLAQAGEGLSLSAINGPQSVVVAGAPEAMERFLPVLAEAGINSRPVKTSKAFHSPLMEPMLDPFEAEAEKIAYRAPQIPLFSNVTGKSLSGEGCIGAAYWRRHALAPVDFHRGMQAVFDSGCTVFIEVGPSPVLSGMATRFAPQSESGPDFLFLPSLRQKQDDNRVMLNGLAALHTRGVPVDWAKVDAGRGRRKVAAPTYPFRPDRHWYTPSEQTPNAAAPASTANGHLPVAAAGASAADGSGTGGALLGASIPCALDSRLFDARIDPAAHACLRDCVMDGMPVVNAGVYLDVALSAARREGVSGPIAIEDYSIPQSLIASEVCAGQLALEPLDEARYAYRFFARPESAGDSAPWVLHAQGRLGPAAPGTAGAAIDEAELAAEFAQQTSGEDHYRQLWQRTIYLGGSARWIDHIWHRPGEAVARIRPAAAGEADPYLLHPGVTDSLLQMLISCMPEGGTPDEAYMLLGIDRLTFHGHDGRELYCRVTVTRSGYAGDVLTATLDVRDAEGTPVLSADGVYMKRADKDAVTRQSSDAKKNGPARPAVAPSAAQTGAAGAARARILALPSNERSAETLRLVTGTIAGVLGSRAEDLDLDEPLPALGLDSLMALQANDQLTRQLAVSLPLVAFIEGCDINGLTDLVLDALGEPTGGDTAEGAGPGAAASLELPADEPPRIVPDPDARFEPFPLTDLQQAYLIGRTDAFELGNVSTYFFTEVDLEGADLGLLADKLNALIARHDMLRAVINNDSTQRVLPEVPRYEIRTYDVSGLEADAREQKLADLHEEMRDQVLDADQWPLFDVRASILGEGRIRLHVAHEALISDAWGASTVFREWAQSVRGEELDEPAEITFRDYVTAAKELEQGPEYAASLEYWRGRVAQMPPAPELPLARDPATVHRPHFVHREHRLDREAWTAFREHAKAAGVTASAAICAAYTEVIAQWSKKPDFTLNMLFFNRMPLHPQVDSIVGNFSSTILLEVHAGGSTPFGERAVKVQQQLWQDLEHSRVSGVRVLREMNQQRGESVRASVPVVFASTVNFAARDTRAAGTGLVQHLLSLGDSGREVSSAIRTPQVWLDHQVIEDDGELIVNWDVVEELFPAGLIDAMHAAYVSLLNELAASPAAWNSPIAPLLGQKELAVRQRVNATAGPRPEGLLHDGFMANAAERPERTAVIAPDRSLTYGELDALSNRIANWLREHGTAPEQLIGVVMHKGWEQVAGALGILKAGAAYVPIDAAVPAERLRTLCETSGITVALTQPGGPAGESWPAGVERLVVDDETLAALSDAPAPPSSADPGDLAYVIFTSGSTGTPKGVMIEHSAAGNTVADVNDRFAVTDQDRVLALSAFNFDLSVYDVFGMLSAGGAIVLPDPDSAHEPARWAELARKHGVTIWNSAPALMELFAQHLASPNAQAPDLVRVVMMSGDWIPVTLPDLIRRGLPGAAIWSLGGATEASIWSIWYPIESVDPQWTSVPYGVPMRNQQFHVLDEQLRPRPALVPGQLYIGGEGLARGYHADGEKTRASFVRHPATGERLYRTGDLGRYRPDGVIEFLGREDDQVKVQGYRIELGEIEAAISHCDGVRATVVQALGDRQGPKRLVAYVVHRPDADPDTARIESALRAVLPEYMVPKQFVQLDEMPLTANGKVNRGALPDPSLALGETVGRAPEGETETRLAAIWGEFFDPALVTADAGFFALGGDSLTAVRLMARIEAEWERVLPVSLLFARPTIAQLAEALADLGSTHRREALVQVRTEGALPPLFFVHPVGGDVLCYAELAARVGGDRPFYALQTPDDLDAPTLTELAAHYVEEVVSAQPDGPWLLGGWSMGGVVAIEMSRLLAASGRTADLVVAVDLLEPPGPSYSGPLGDDDLLEWFARDLAGLSGSDWTPRSAADSGGDQDGGETVPSTHPDRVQSLRRSLVSAGVLPSDIGAEAFHRIIERFMANSRLLEAHSPAPSGVRTLLLRAADGGADEKTAAAWVDLLGDEDTSVEAVPGDHYSVVAPPAVDVVADAIRRAMNP
ncbi:amino acid adenylation domain-containing protein [Streptomyces sp. NPDC002809]|uniref:non-ribosomal peptide synthetase/type I polyketide synthase n=1 Tax=Streptomyces sp. NPDC002809 TaxID=3154433 RepID=UPI00331EA488